VKAAGPLGAAGLDTTMQPSPWCCDATASETTVRIVVVEELRFRPEAGHLERFLLRDHEVWTRYLTAQPGFVRKQVWLSPDRSEVVMQIWWEDRESWKAVLPDAVATIEEAMGALSTPPTCNEYVVWEPPPS
jgi:uncharacterized protein (TIGR03792 family)